jgi:orotate phosphoribosyltransferase
MSWADGTYTACSSYLESILIPEQRKKTINRVVRHLKPRLAEFDAIAVCGVSGLLVGPSISDKLGKPLIVVRKMDDSSTHSTLKVEGSLLGRYLILDDLICSGNTVRHIVKAIQGHNEFAVCVGIYTFAEYVFPTLSNGAKNHWLQQVWIDKNGVDEFVCAWYNAKATKRNPKGVWL